MEACVEGLSSKGAAKPGEPRRLAIPDHPSIAPAPPADSKVRLEALSSLSDLLVAGVDDLSTVCKLVASCVADNNQKASSAACGLIGKLAEVSVVRSCCVRG
jgi:hypothetical protein